MTSPPPSELNVGDKITFYHDAKSYDKSFLKDSKWVVTKKSTDNIGDETITFKSTNLDKEYNKTNKITNLEDLEQYYTKIYDMVYQAGGRKSRLTRNKRTKSKRIRKSRKVRNKRNKSKRRSSH